MIDKGIHSSAIIENKGELTLPESTVLEPLVVLYVGQDGELHLGERNIIYPQTTIRIERGWMKTGKDVSFGPGCQIYEPRAGLEIGDNCLIAGGVKICGVQHGIQSPDIPMRRQESRNLPIHIEEDVWIGMGCIIMPGVTIGRSSVIGAGSVVTHDIPGYSIAYGTPCEVQKGRRRDLSELQLPADGRLKLHLGCGEKYIPGFIHVDAYAAPHIDFVGDVSKLDFVARNTVDLIYASHILEHFDRWRFREVLTEWREVLKPGGTLRLAVPDFAACAKLYYEEGLRDGLSGLIGLICGGQRYDRDYHKMIFDETFLRHELISLGFRNVRRWDWRKTDHADIDDYSQAYLPHMDKEHGVLMSLNLECDK